ncbi:MAG: FAD-dependent oxidoreductase [Gammaproteobacteria bacterium]
MVQHSDWDYLIVGQGLAGSLLAWQLRERGRRVLVIDDAHRGAASTAAAGLVNPLAGMRYSLPARIEDWRQAAEGLYERIGRHFGRRYFHALPMLRLFRSPEQVRFWERRAAEPRAAAYLGERFAAGRSGQPVHAPCGGFHQHLTGYLDVADILADVRAELIAAGCLRDEALDHAALRPGDGQVSWGGVTAGQVVYCEGHRLAANPWFDWLPLRTDRGEILTLQAAAGLPDRIVNGAHWLVPLVGGGCRAGSTHDPEDTDPAPTAAARDEILAGVRAMLPEAGRLSVSDQRVGVRPGSADRQPFVGRHPRQPRLCVLNGFGARGSLTIPWYAGRLIEHLEHGTPLPAEADPARCAALQPA